MKQNKLVNTDEELVDGLEDVDSKDIFAINGDEEEEELNLTIDERIYNSFENKLNDQDSELDNEEIEDVAVAIPFVNGFQVPLEDAVQDYQDFEKGKGGTQDAFDFIYDHYKPKLERLAWRKNDEDLAQELSIVLLRAIQTFDINGGAKFNTYYWKCARNHIGTLNIRKNAKKRTAEYGVISMQQSFNTKDSEVEFGTFVEDKDAETVYEQKMFRMILESNVYPYLKKNEVTAVKMLLDGYTLEEIGFALGGITAPAVHVKFKRLAVKKHVGKQLRYLFSTYLNK